MDDLSRRQVYTLRRKKLPICFFCKHLYQFSNEEFRASFRDKAPERIIKCPAIPDGIPAEITVNLFDHRKPYPGDSGVRFEKLEEPRIRSIYLWRTLDQINYSFSLNWEISPDNDSSGE